MENIMKNSMRPLVILAILALSLPAAAQSWNLEALKREAAKGLSGGQLLASSNNDRGCFVGMMKDGANFQFTLSSDDMPHLPDAKEMKCKGYKAYFFEPIPGAGGLMIVLGDQKSLTILCTTGLAGGKDATPDYMVAIAKKMDLKAL